MPPDFAFDGMRQFSQIIFFDNIFHFKFIWNPFLFVPTSIYYTVKKKVWLRSGKVNKVKWDIKNFMQPAYNTPTIDKKACFDIKFKHYKKYVT